VHIIYVKESTLVHPVVVVLYVFIPIHLRKNALQCIPGRRLQIRILNKHINCFVISFTRSRVLN
jgi:hypothetical protein